MDAGIMGDAGLLRAIAELSGPEVRKAIMQGLRSGGKIQLAASKALAPRLHGHLRKSLILRVGKRNRPGTKSMVVWVDPKKAVMFKKLSGVAGEGSTRVESKKGKAGEAYFYPAAQEFGWTSGGKRYPGKSYLRAGFDAKKEIMAMIIDQTIWTKMMTIWGRKTG